jgi:hypothetical protein
LPGPTVVILSGSADLPALASSESPFFFFGDVFCGAPFSRVTFFFLHLDARRSNKHQAFLGAFVPAAMSLFFFRKNPFAKAPEIETKQKKLYRTCKHK